MSTLVSLRSALRNWRYSKRVRHDDAVFVDWGIDFSFGNGLTIEQMEADSVQFVGRYLSSPGNPKNIDQTELDSYLASGIGVVFYFETTGLMLTASQGESDARSALAQAAALGAPDAVIFFTLDTDPTAPGVVPAARDYMRGVRLVLPWHQRGTYGGYAWVKSYFDGNLGKYACQTYAWSGDQWDSRAQLQQWENDVTLGPAQVDLERSTTTDFGQYPKPVPPLPSINPVRRLRRKRRGYTSINVVWKAPKGATSYTVEARWPATDGEVVDSFTCTYPAARIRDLQPQHEYEIRVRAHPGSSTGSDASIHVTTR